MRPLGFSSALPLHIATARTSTVKGSNRRPTTITAERTRRAANVPGDFYVDTRCIDCDACRWIAPNTFGRAGSKSAVHTQPSDADTELQALLAASACPTSSIHTTRRNPRAREAAQSFPIAGINSLTETPVSDVFYNGFSSEATFGCSSWLLLHRGPNPFAVMFDVPRFNKALLSKIQQLAAPVSGVHYIVLSHSDDVAGHARWAAALAAQRVIHKADVREHQGTHECEIQLSDAAFPYKIDDGCEVLHVPGHTKGSIALLDRPTESLFTGDHLFYSARTGVLAGSSTYCFYSWEEQIRSMETLTDVEFLHGWPGHGRHFHFQDAEDRKKQIQKAVEYMKSVKSPAGVWS